MTPDMVWYKEHYDKPDEVVMAETGWPLVGVWAVKDAMLNAGLVLEYPPPEGYNTGWTKVGTGTPIPPPPEEPA